MFKLTFAKQDCTGAILKSWGPTYRGSERFSPSNSTEPWNLSVDSVALNLITLDSVALWGFLITARNCHSVTQSLDLQVVRQSLMFFLWAEFRHMWV